METIFQLGLLQTRIQVRTSHIHLFHAWLSLDFANLSAVQDIVESNCQYVIETGALDALYS